MPTTIKLPAALQQPANIPEGSAEWIAFTQASAKTQRPTLIQALRSVRDGSINAAVTPSHDTRRYLRTLVSAAQVERNAAGPWKGAGPAKGFRDRLQRWAEGLVADASSSWPSRPSGAAKSSSSMARAGAAEINVERIFKLLSPAAEVRSM